VSFTACQDEAERAAFGVAAGVELGGEAAARSAKRLGFLSPFFVPAAQWCARTMVELIMSAVGSRSTISARLSSMASKTPLYSQRR
jgi:hypothetical protein